MSITSLVTYTISATPKHSQSSDIVYNETGAVVMTVPGQYIVVKGEMTDEVKESIDEHFDVMDDLNQIEKE